MNTTKKEITLFDASRCLEDVGVSLMDVSAALQLLDESLETDGFQRGKIDERDAARFVKRLPLYIGLLRVIESNLSGIIGSLDTDADSIRNAYNDQKEVSA